MDTYVELVSETCTDDKIVQRMRDSAAFKQLGDAGKCTHQGIFYNPHLCAESSSKPHCRPPPLRQNGDHLRRLVCLTLRAQDWQILDQQLFFIFDGGKAGNKATLLSCFVDADNTPLSKVVRSLTLMLDESSADRMSLSRGFMNLEQEQHVHVCSKSVVTLTPHERLHFCGHELGQRHLSAHLACVDIPRCMEIASATEEGGHRQDSKDPRRRARAR